MSDKYFIDTNVFVYSFDNREPLKRERSIEIIRDALEKSTGVISTQVLQEFLNVATRKFVVPMKVDDSKAYLRQVLNPLCQVYPDFSLYETCLDVQSGTGYSFYDSLIISAAIRVGCNVLYSEDLQDGQQVRSVKIVNPYRGT